MPIYAIGPDKNTIIHEFEAENDEAARKILQALNTEFKINASKEGENK